MDPAPAEEPFNHLDDTFAPLKRNHACLACKKRKVKCCGTRPSCSPCVRSHAHAIRAASRAGVAPPTLVCDWADADSPSTSPVAAVPVKKTSGKKMPLNIGKEKARRQEDEKGTLLARIAELESRLAGLTPPSSESSGSGSTPSVNDLLPVPELDWEFSSFLLIPSNWPRNLPAPYLLEHLLQIFFTSVPQIPRMFNRTRLMARTKLPPNHSDFPHPSLLHAICATAAQYTAMVNSLPAHAITEAVQEKQRRGESLESFEDFALAQAESAHRTIHQTHQLCTFGSAAHIFEIFQAEVLISNVWSSRGMFLRGWSEGGQVARIGRALELANRNHPKRYKAGILPAPADDVEREERLASIWYAFMSEAFTAVSRYWPISLDDREFFAALPAGSADVARGGRVVENPQTARDPALYSEHPIHDVFVLNCKVAMFCARTSRFLRDWAQREIRPGDEYLGMHLQIFKDIVRDIQVFQRTVPDVFKNVLRLQPGAINSELLSLHIMPHMALLMLYEPFADWDNHSQDGVRVMLSSYEACMRILHQIPSNLDLSYITTIEVASNLHNLGRFIVDFIKAAMERQAYGLVVHYQTDLAEIQSLLGRLNKQPLAAFSLNFLNTYLEAAMNGEDLNGPCPGGGFSSKVSARFQETVYEDVGGFGNSTTLGGIGSMIALPATDVGFDMGTWAFDEGQAL